MEIENIKWTSLCSELVRYRLKKTAELEINFQMKGGGLIMKRNNNRAIKNKLSPYYKPYFK